MDDDMYDDTSIYSYGSYGSYYTHYPTRSPPPTPPRPEPVTSYDIKYIDTMGERSGKCM